jgi:hypothetical protein
MKFKTIILTLLAFGLALISSTRAEMTKWTSIRGTTVDAELVDYNSTTITLKLKDGQRIKVLRDQLILPKNWPNQNQPKSTNTTEPKKNWGENKRETNNTNLATLVVGNRHLFGLKNGNSVTGTVEKVENDSVTVLNQNTGTPETLTTSEIKYITPEIGIKKSQEDKLKVGSRIRYKHPDGNTYTGTITEKREYYVIVQIEGDIKMEPSVGFNVMKNLEILSE